MLIIDDDRVVTTVFKAHLSTHYPEAQIDTINQAKAVPSYDVYFIDNDFEGEHLAYDLIKAIRQIEPQALIVTLSRTIDLNTLRKLLNLGCNAAYSKQDPNQSADARDVISNYLSILEKQRCSPQPRRAFADTISSLFGLLEEWNKRLSIDLSKDTSSAR